MVLQREVTEVIEKLCKLYHSVFHGVEKVCIDYDFIVPSVMW